MSWGRAYLGLCGELGPAHSPFTVNLEHVLVFLFPYSCSVQGRNPYMFSFSPVEQLASPLHTTLPFPLAPGTAPQRHSQAPIR